MQSPGGRGAGCCLTTCDALCFGEQGWRWLGEQKPRHASKGLRGSESPWGHMSHPKPEACRRLCCAFRATWGVPLGANQPALGLEGFGPALALPFLR